MPKTKTNRSKRNELPRDLRIVEADGASDFEIIAADGGEEDSPKLRRFTMTAYTGGRLDLPNFPYPVVVDLSGMQVPAKSRPILRDHGIDRIVGHTESIDVNRGTIRLAGVISGSNEHAREVTETAGNGFPWQASIGARADKVAFVDEGESVDVNGRRFNGPLYVARRSTLREVSFVALGADDRTSATLAATADNDTHEETELDENEIDAEFADWLDEHGFDPDRCDESQAASLRAWYDRERAGGDTDASDVRAADTPDDDPIADLRSRRATEVRRMQRITAICEDRFPEIEARAIEEGWDETRTELEVLRASRPRGPMIHSDDGSNRSAPSIEAALCLSAGLPEETVGREFDDRTMERALSRDLRGAGIHTLLYEVVRAAGMHVRPGRVDDDVIATAFRANARLLEASRGITASGGFSTLSLSGILSNVANKTLLAAYRAVDAKATTICGSTDVNNFHQVTRYRMTAAGVFEKVGADGELKHATLDQEAYTNQVDTYGRMIALTRKMIVNDDLGAFLQIPRMIGRMSALALEEAVFTLLLANPGGFFSAGNANFFDGASSALDIDSLTTAERMFLDRVDSDGRPILVNPALLLAPTNLKVTAEQLFNQTEINQTPAGNKAKPAGNPHAGKFRPVVSPYLTLGSIPGNSQTAWYVLADPMDVAALEIAYLRGRRVPTIEGGETDFNTLGVQWRGWFDFGVATQDHRAGVMSAGQ